METISSWTSFGGKLSVHQHDSELCQCPMQFAVYTPPQVTAGSTEKVPVIWYLSGLTCNWSNVMEKSGLQRIAAKLGVMIIAPDTSPRGDDVPNDDAYDLGQGAGFYLSATQEPWSTHFHMDRYLVEELSALVFKEFAGDADRQGIMGHSMGGHGALTLHLKHPETFRSVSALSPIASPAQVPWGEKAFTTYLGDDRSQWSDYDATELVGKQPSKAHILVDTGDADPFLEEQLRPALFIDACQKAGQSLNYRIQPGYDHSYWFIASVIEDHLEHHAAILKG
ncbi:S-formylglutathione hydrolase [Granulosicoccus antarcticus]|uniref:S-formylglutathione hydrolase n=1 Tax=Granulosicoccus antarcticus IMCC3135 TaxID=1192854 RepID=A0A2Z2NU96_9GAMM|nr:S-formylglutathione hydrolase [Granulosicoccus antarcticus]ASJ74823.1 S-formylglutathione hydrolase [Granulosicoccus antarcticus IMCC3135]